MPYYSLRLSETEFTEDERQNLAKEGKALPDGSYPIRNKKDLKNAIECVGLGGNTKTAIHRHIIGQARELGAEDMLPDSWDVGKKESFEGIQSGAKSIGRGLGKATNAVSSVVFHPAVGAGVDAAMSADREKNTDGSTKKSILSAGLGGTVGSHYGAKLGVAAGDKLGGMIGGHKGAAVGQLIGGIAGGAAGQIYGGKAAGSVARPNKIAEPKADKIESAKDDEDTESAEEESADYLNHFANYRKAQKLITSAEESLSTGELTDPDYDEAIMLATQAIDLCDEEHIVCMAKKIVHKAMLLKDKHGISEIVAVTTGLAINPELERRESAMSSGLIDEFMETFERHMRESEEKVAAPISNKDLANKIGNHIKKKIANSAENLGSKTITAGGLAKIGGAGIALYGAKKAYDAARGSGSQYHQESYEDAYVQELLEGERSKNLAREVKNRVMNGAEDAVKSAGSKTITVKGLAKIGGAGIAAYGAKKVYDKISGHDSAPQYRQESYRDPYIQELLEAEEKQRPTVGSDIGALTGLTAGAYAGHEVANHVIPKIVKKASGVIEKSGKAKLIAAGLHAGKLATMAGAAIAGGKIGSELGRRYGSKENSNLSDSKKESSYPSHLSRVEFPEGPFAPYAQAYEPVSDNPISDMWSTFNQHRVHRTTGR